MIATAQDVRKKDKRTEISSLIEPEIKHGQFNPKVVARTSELKSWDVDVGKADTSTTNGEKQNEKPAVYTARAKDVKTAPKSAGKRSNSAVIMWSFYAFLAALIFLVIYYSVFIYDKNGVSSPVSKSIPEKATPEANSRNTPTFNSQNNPEAKQSDQESSSKGINVNSVFDVKKGDNGQKVYYSKTLGVEFESPADWVQCETFFELSKDPSMTLYKGKKCPIVEGEKAQLTVSYSPDTLQKLLEDPLMNFSEKADWKGKGPKTADWLKSTFIESKDKKTAYRVYYGSVQKGNIMISVPVRSDASSHDINNDVSDVLSTLKKTQ